MVKIYFISGVCGVGKSSIMPHLKSLLSSDKFEIHDFDERGVPDDADRNWRISESKYWIEKGMESAKTDKNTIICGFIKPDDIQNSLPEVEMILLDAKPEIIRERLMKRYSKDGIFDESQKVIGKPVREFIEDNVYFQEPMKKSFKEKNYPIINTSKLTPLEVAEKVASII